MTRVMIMLIALAGCTPPEQPEVRTYGALYPLCLFWCSATIITDDAEGVSNKTSSVSSMTTTQRN